MDKSREAFEKKFPIPAHWIEFDEKRNKYYCPYVADAKASEYQAMWEVWQSRQAEFDSMTEALLNQTQLLAKKQAEVDALKNQLIKAGFTDRGGQLLVPPQGKPPRFDLLDAKQAELDQAYADIETFAQAHQRECEFKAQFAKDVDFLKAQLGIKRDQIKGFESEIKKTWQALEKKDKRIEELELALTRIKSWESHPKSYETAFGSWGLRDFYRNLADKALRGEHE